MMQPTDLTDVITPPWLAVAALVFGRIDSLRPPTGDDMVAPSDLLPQLLSATAARDMSPEELNVWIDEDMPFSANPDPMPGPRNIAVRSRLNLLRLCAGIGDIARLTLMAKPGTLTVIEGIPTSNFDVLAKLISDDVVSLARAMSVGGKGSTAVKETAKTIILKPGISDGTVTPREEQRLDARLADALESDAPILILLPAGLMMSKSLLAASPLRISLTPVSRAILLRFWTKTHPKLVKTNAAIIAKRLPPDDQLASMTDVVLLTALRRGDPRRVADELSTRTTKTLGPCLADLPDSAAAFAAKALVADLRAWREGIVSWDEIPHSLLLHGPAGAGKSYIAKAMSAEPGLRFISASFAEWQRCGHLGDLLKAMHQSFSDAMAGGPCILFIDEIDSASSRTDTDSHNLSYRRQVINGFLLAVDQVNSAGGVVLVGACNDLGALDSAILRPGRFDLKVEVPLPHRAAIASVLTRGLGTALTADEIDQVSRRMIGHSMASVDALIRGAKSSARRSGRPVILSDLEAELPNDQPSSAAMWRVAVHEAGHAVVAHLLQQGRVTRLSIRGEGGLTERTLNPTESLLSDFDNHITVNMAGRAAERVILGTISAGSGGSKASDLAQSTQLARLIETSLGLGDYGPVWSEDTNVRDPGLYARIRTRIEAAEARAVDMIRAHQPGIEVLARALVSEGELSGKRLDDLLQHVSTFSQVRGGEEFPLAG